MALEANLTALLKTLCPRVYPDIAPEPMPVRPFVTYQQVGGQVVNFMDNKPPGKRNARVQINVWSNSRLEATALANAIEDALRLSTAFQASPIGALASEYEADIRLYGARQDFSVWHT